MQDDLHQPNGHDAQPLGLNIQLAAHGHLRKRETIVASLPAKTRRARLFGSFTHAAEERLECQSNTNRNVLQDVRLHTRQGRSFGLQGGQCGVLIVELDRLVPLLPGVAPFGQQVVVQPPTLLKLLLKETPLLLIWVQAVRECFTHAGSLTQSMRVVKGEGHSSPAYSDLREAGSGMGYAETSCMRASSTDLKER